MSFKLPQVLSSNTSLLDLTANRERALEGPPTRSGLTWVAALILVLGLATIGVSLGLGLTRIPLLGLTKNVFISIPVAGGVLALIGIVWLCILNKRYNADRRRFCMNRPVVAKRPQLLAVERLQGHSAQQQVAMAPQSRGLRIEPDAPALQSEPDVVALAVEADSAEQPFEAPGNNAQSGVDEPDLAEVGSNNEEGEGSAAAELFDRNEQELYPPDPEVVGGNGAEEALGLLEDPLAPIMPLGDDFVEST